MSATATFTSGTSRRDGAIWAVTALVIAVGLAVAPAAPGALFRPATMTVAFLAGLVTGSHCIGMCGGFVLCYAARGSRGVRAHLSYAGAKTASYMAIGAGCGAFGKAISAGGRWPGVAALGAGVFLLVTGAYLIAGQIRPTRWRFAVFDTGAAWLHDRIRRAANPIALGIANGLMLGCGPLLAMYAAAAGTGSAGQGALLLGAFGVGTLPVMLGSAWLASSFGARFQRRMSRWSGPLVLISAGLMLQRASALTPRASAAVTIAEVSTPAVQVIRMAAIADGWVPAEFIIRQGAPVKWIIDGRKASTCTARLRIPWLGRELDLSRGESVVEFTPQETGELTFSCWMGMARGHVIVVPPAPTRIAHR